MDMDPAEISDYVWRAKYRLVDAGRSEAGIADSWRRVARAIAAAEPSGAPLWEARFFDLLQDRSFLPGGRIQAGAGTARNVTLFNCFVMGEIEDSIPGIFRALEEAAVTMQAGGGIGLDFSTLRPRGLRAWAAGTIASGPVSFMQIWDAMCGTVLSTGARRGAMMATLRCDHPDIAEFVSAKHRPGMLRRFNMSVQVTDAFMAAVRSDAAWPLVFPAAAFGPDDQGGESVARRWPGLSVPVPCRVVRRVGARALWDDILRSTYDFSEPGVLFVDRINASNTLWYCERISATNPCGEMPLPPYGACDLGSLNLACFVRAPFTPQADLDTGRLAEATRGAVRFLDDVIDVSRYPLPQQAENARASRRIGLGVTGLADMLLMLGLRYDSAQARAVAADMMRVVCHAAYRASVALAREKSPFPRFVRDAYMQGPFIRALPGDIRDAIAASGIRNSHLLAIAPTGSISLLAGNVSSGLEPIFAASHHRTILDETAAPRDFLLTDYAVEVWARGAGARGAGGESGRPGLPPAFVSASDLGPEDHIAMQAALQPFVDSAISKTVNVPQDYPFDAFKRVYDLAYDSGLKGCTTFRPNPVTGMVLSDPQCCTAGHEADYTSACHD
ncbi:adenosylcobalamin-dependent ribonucleoside-diphosphate reductase [Nguyenibacter vanlangensis]|uniref:Vitamin B12-dependent ribonucleotide reductase n=1 Tax=Nguyenibacter vanlangensis TaxID=1216886 RepID=A0ABZ3D8Q8_9PROT